jgi:hypothetical protein
MLIHIREIRGRVVTDMLLCWGINGSRKLWVGSTKLIHNDDVYLLEMLYQGMQVVDLKTTA